MILQSCVRYIAPYCCTETFQNFFYKFWWDEELDILKEDSIKPCRIWKAVGRPRSGPIFDSYRKAKAAYRAELRSRQRSEESFYTNELHEALQKNKDRHSGNVGTLNLSPGKKVKYC